jgi:hypothetical protein
METPSRKLGFSYLKHLFFNLSNYSDNLFWTAMDCDIGNRMRNVVIMVAEAMQFRKTVISEIMILFLAAFVKFIRD